MPQEQVSPSERAEYDRSGDGTSLNGVERLRAERGSEQVSFDELADHLVGFIERHPHAREEIDNLAAFLAAVEHREHESPARR